MTHGSYSNVTRMCDIRRLMIEAMPRALGCIRLNIGPPSTRTSTTISDRQIRRPPVLRVGQRAANHLLQHPRPALRLVAQQIQRLVGELAPDQVGQQPHLARD